jgi:hypothetical protein
LRAAGYDTVHMKFQPLPLVLIIAAVALGPLTAQYGMTNAQVSSSPGNAGWVEVRSEGDDMQAMYRSGYFLTKGQVPPPKGSRFFVRNEDDEGNSLRGDCVVSVEGKVPDARWWFVSATRGSQRSTLDASETVREASGDHAIAISSNPTPGNWLEPPGTGSYELQLVLLGVDATGDASVPPLPRVKRLWC